MITLGLDVSSSSTGWAILKHGRFFKREGVDYGWIKPPLKLKAAEKLAYYRESISNIPWKMDAIGLEDTFFLRNVKTLKVLSRFAGVTLEYCWSIYKIEPLIVPVTEIRAVWGTQGKKETFNEVTLKFKLDEWTYSKHNDIADALAVAFYVHKTF